MGGAMKRNNNLSPLRVQQVVRGEEALKIIII